MEPIRATKGGVIIPEWGNDARTEKEQIAVHYHFLSFAEQQALLDPRDIGKSFAYEARVIGAAIDKIDNLSVEDEDGAREIETGEQLIAEPCLDQLAYELWITLRNKTAIDKKK